MFLCNENTHLGYEIKALSNLLRRKIWGTFAKPTCESLTEIEGMVLGFLFHNQDREIFQKDIETTFCIRSSTASRLLKQLEDGGFIERHPGSTDARLKQVVVTPKATALYQQIEQRIVDVEAILARGVSPEELDQFMKTLQKLKQNLL